VGKEVSLPPSQQTRLYSSTLLHASEKPLHALMYAVNIFDTALLEVEGEEKVEEWTKFGFFSLKVTREVPDNQKNELFGFHFNELVNPINPCDINCDFDEYAWRDFVNWITITESTKNHPNKDNFKTVQEIVVSTIRSSDWWFIIEGMGLTGVTSLFFGSPSPAMEDIRKSIISLLAQYYTTIPEFAFYNDCKTVEDVMWAFVGSHFHKIHHWAYLDDKFGYPFQCIVNLWKKGFIPLQIQGKWKLCHPIKGQAAQIIWEE
jgi:hypothetical protein